MNEVDISEQSLSPEMLQHVLAFLRKNNLTEAEEALSKEASSVLRGQQPTALHCPSNEQVLNEFATLLHHVDASFDFFQAEFALLIFPVFAHSYIKLVLEGHPQMAITFMHKFGRRVPSPYEEEVKSLSLLTTSDQALSDSSVQHLLKQAFVVKISKSCMKQLEPLLARLPSIGAIIKEHIQIESTDGVSKQKSTVEWQMGGLLGQISRNDKRHKMYYGIAREDCLYPMDKKRFKGKDDNKKRELNAPLPDRIPLPPLGETLRRERANTTKDVQKMTVIGAECAPSVCLYTTLNAHCGVSSCTLSDDSSFLALGFGDSGISVFSLDDSQRLKRLKSIEELERLDQETEELHDELYDMSSLSSSVALPGHFGSVYSLHFSPDKRLLLSTAKDRTIRLWSLDTQSNVVAIRVGSPVWQAVFCPRGYYYATASADNTACVWATDRMHPLRIFADALSQVGCVDFHTNCNYVVGGSDDRNVRVWDVLSGSCVRSFSGHRSPVRTVKFSPCGRYVSSISADGSLLVWDLAMQRLIGADTRELPTRIPSISFSREGGNIAVSRGGCEVSIYSLDNLIMATASQGNDYTFDPKIDMRGFECYSFLTKNTPIVGLHFTRRNLLLGVGAFNQ